MSEITGGSHLISSSKSFLLTIFDVAFRSRLSLPLLISAGFMLFNIQVRLELELEADVQRLPEEEEEEN